MNQLKTKYAEKLDPKNVRGEYPRPNLVRDSFLSLNGYWEYAICKKPTLTTAMQGKILVPFPIESLLSGVQKTLNKGEEIVYKRSFTLPEDFQKKDVLLHFEAVDYFCRVFVNGNEIFTHRGGYLPFSINITGFLQEVNELVVLVQDDTNNDGAATGKQRLKRGGIWYTPCSGIWQSVWLESVPEGYFEDVRVTPNFDAESVSFELTTRLPQGEIMIVSQGHVVSKTAFHTSKITIPLPQPHLWSPEDPFLYDVEISNSAETVKTYFGMRKVSLGESQYGPCLMLNNKPYFMNGVLDQGYYSDGIYTPASEQAFVDDILVMKSLGLNTLRKHIKIEDRRFYYQCDRLGMLVWQDFPSGGKYAIWSMTIMPTLGFKGFNDHKYRAFGRQSIKNRTQFIDEIWESMKLLDHYPCIVMWVPFNEGWGQFDSKPIAEMVKKKDPTRLVDHVSGWFDQGGPDIASHHIYFKKIVLKPDSLNRPIAVTEFGGYSLKIEDHVFNSSKEFGYRKFTSKEAFETALIRLYEEEILGNMKNGLCAAIYTQVSDVEDEINGFLTYDREVLKVNPENVASVLTKIQF